MSKPRWRWRWPRVRRPQATPLGTAVADAPIIRDGRDGSPLGDLFAEALRASTGADVAIVNSSPRGGLRADLPGGRLTFGALYDVFPFDNQVALLRMTGAQLEALLGSAEGPSELPAGDRGRVAERLSARDGAVTGWSHRAAW
ncbi:MAG: 5'-nucleotidase [Vicinamibacterales bacterium]